MRSARSGPRRASTRRAWLSGMAASAIFGPTALAAPPKLSAEDAEERRKVEARAEEAGLGPFRVSRTTHYLALGDAPAAFGEKALAICEGLARDYLDHFRTRKFAVEAPKGRLTVILLGSAKSFATFLGRPEGTAVGGQYDLDTNRLVIFDNRDNNRADVARAESANLVALAHEATHQLTYNTGLLRREGDVPLCIAEGLAMYAETRKPTGRSAPGQVNVERIKALAIARGQGARWIPLPELLNGDGILGGDDGEPSQQAAYAQSWLLVYDLMKAAGRLDGFRAYLTAIGSRKDDAHRLEDAKEHLGDLEALDAALRKHADRLVGRG